MEMDIDKAKGEEQGKPIMVIMVGAPGSGKSTFCEQVMRSSTRPWVRVCQDTINNGKSGTKIQCLGSASSALKDGKSVFIDRCNLDREQRGDFVKLGGLQIDLHAVVLDLPAQLCISRSVKRTGHEGKLQGGKAAAVVNRMLQKKELPKQNEGYARITFCQNEKDVQGALSIYSALGPLDTLPNGCFGQKNPDAKIQLGIMKFLKKVEVPANPVCNTNSVQECVCKGPENVSSLSSGIGEAIKDDEDMAGGSIGSDTSLNDVPTLAFPSISTADFQFNHEKAADIIVEKVEEFLNRLGNVRIVLVDLTHKSKILSLVRIKVAQRNIDSNKFLTFVGDITCLYSGGGLRCNVIANAANWRLKPGGGGTNAAIFSAAGPSLEIATKERAKTLLPGNTVVVPLPSTSPLFIREGVTHVIHVLGPNMNPQRPNCLDNDYIKGCKILREAYTLLFEAFASIVRTQAKLTKGKSEDLGTEPSELQEHVHSDPKFHFSSNDLKSKRDCVYDNERNKKSRGSPDEVGVETSESMVSMVRKGNQNNDKNDGKTKAWGPWAQSLFHIAMHPERHKDDVLEILDDVVVLNDLYPKAQRHLLVLARSEGLDCLADVSKENIQLLKTMHAVGLRWAQKFLCEDASLVFRLGYHLAPSMRQLHLHVISQDFNSKHLKNKKHWNSFTTTFFCDSVDIIQQVNTYGKATLNDDDSLLSMELRCHRCKSAHPNIPRLKSHISNCRISFPAALLQNSRLVLAATNPGIVP